MEVGKTYCTRCGGEVKGFTCQICDPTIPVKQLTIEEIREQFEKSIYTGVYNPVFDVYKQAYIDMGLLKE